MLPKIMEEANTTFLKEHILNADYKGLWLRILDSWSAHHLKLLKHRQLHHKWMWINVFKKTVELVNKELL